MRFVDGTFEEDGEPVLVVGLRGRAGNPKVIGEGEQPLLRTVMKVAFKAPPGGVAGLHDPRTRDLQIVELRKHLGLELLVLDPEPRPGADLPRELVLGQVATGMTDEGDLPAVPNDRGEHASS